MTQWNARHQRSLHHDPFRIHTGNRSSVRELKCQGALPITRLIGSIFISLSNHFDVQIPNRSCLNGAVLSQQRPACTLPANRVGFVWVSMCRTHLGESMPDNGRKQRVLTASGPVSYALWRIRDSGGVKRIARLATTGLPDNPRIRDETDVCSEWSTFVFSSRRNPQETWC